MQATQDLHDRLERLKRQIDGAKAQLKDKDRWHDLHHLTAGELKARYDYLTSQVTAEIADAEAQGHRVSKLEQSVRGWLDDLDL